MKALIFGSTTVLSDTSDLESKAYNHAFRTHRIDAHWTAEHVQHLQATGQLQSAIDSLPEGIETTKTRAYHDLLDQTLPTPTARVGELIDAIKTLQLKLAMVTDEPRATVNLIRAGVLSDRASRFDAIVTSDDGFAPKPDPDRYLHVLEALELVPADCATIEVSQAGIDAAKNTGLQVFTLAGFERNHGLVGAESTCVLREQLNASFQAFQFSIAAE